jgi:hypothetical protein
MLRKERVPHLLRNRVLDGDALYRVVDVNGDCVEVEVVSAPGLVPGVRLHLTQAAVARMSVVAQAAWKRGEQGPETESRTSDGAAATHPNH